MLMQIAIGKNIGDATAKLAFLLSSFYLLISILITSVLPFIRPPSLTFAKTATSDLN